jgi:hypothetical protein
MEGNILNDFFLFVDVAFGKRDVLFSLQIEFTGIGIASSDSFYVAG